MRRCVRWKRSLNERWCAGWARVGRGRRTCCARFAQEPSNLIRQVPGLFDQAQRGRECDPAGVGVFEHAAFETAALRRPIRVDPTRAIHAQGRARLAKAGDRRLGARDRNRQSERLQFLRVIVRSEPDVAEERAVAAQPAGETELFSGFHARPPSGSRRSECKPGGYEGSMRSCLPARCGQIRVVLTTRSLRVSPVLLELGCG